MKRGRISDTERKGIEPGEFSHILTDYSGPNSFSDLPDEIMMNVLLRLSIRRIIVCKAVCKTWRDLISKPEFVKLHSEKAQAYPLIQIFGCTERPTLLYLVQPEESDFEKKLEMCDHNDYDSECDCLVEFQLDTKFQLPLPEFDDDEGFRLGYRAVNSCNGLLCLSSPSLNDLLVVCNPVTGEFINLPKFKRLGRLEGFFQCGFGLSPTSNQYKVIRMFERFKRVSLMGYNIFEPRAEIHTLVTETWKGVDVSARGICWSNPTYLHAGSESEVV